LRASKTQLAVLRRMSEGAEITLMRGRDPHAFLRNPRGTEASDAVRLDTVHRLRKLGLIEDVSPEAMRWRSSDYRITRTGRKLMTET